MKQKNIEKIKRIKYIRALEKFFTKTVSLVKNKSITKDIFFKKIDEFYEVLKEVEPVILKNSYLIKLQDFINFVLNLDKEEDFENLKQKIIKESNLVHKEKNISSYKRLKNKIY